MYCKVTHPILSQTAVQQLDQRLDQLILNLQTLETGSHSSTVRAGAGAGAPDAQLPDQSQPAQLTQLIPLATVLDSAQGDAIWFASPRNAQLMLNSAQLNPPQLNPPQLNCALPRRELEPGEAGSPLLYRAAGCNRARKCCCTCTKLCLHRCLHDCFIRLWLWRRELDSLGIATGRAQPAQPNERDAANQKLVSAASPYFATQCAVLNVYTSYKQLSQVIGSTVSARMNAHIQEARARGGTNLNSMDYSMQLKLNAKGKPIADPETGRLEVLYWPQSGLCPFCLPDRSYQLKKRMKKVGMPK